MEDQSILHFIQMVYLIPHVMLMFAMVLISMGPMPTFLHFSILILWDAMVKDHLQIFISNAQQIPVSVEFLMSPQKVQQGYQVCQVSLF